MACHSCSYVFLVLFGAVLGNVDPKVIRSTERPESHASVTYPVGNHSYAGRFPVSVQAINFELGVEGSICYSIVNRATETFEGEECRRDATYDKDFVSNLPPGEYTITAYLVDAVGGSMVEGSEHEVHFRNDFDIGTDARELLNELIYTTLHPDGSASCASSCTAPGEAYWRNNSFFSATPLHL